MVLPLERRPSDLKCETLFHLYDESYKSVFLMLLSLLSKLLAAGMIVT
jgi:hypothetical protein